MESPLDFEDRFPLQLFFYSLPLKHVETKKRGFGLFFYSSKVHSDTLIATIFQYII